MKTRVRKWGNSLALRIPKAFAVEARLGESSRVELSLANGKLMVRALVEVPPTLDELVRGVTDENTHGEWATGPAVGKEVC